jgi:hypothetical protein
MKYVWVLVLSLCLCSPAFGRCHARPIRKAAKCVVVAPAKVAVAPVKLLKRHCTKGTCR